MRRMFVMTLGLVIAVLIAYAPLAYLATGGQTHQILTQQSLTDVKDRVPSPSDVDKDVFVPACKVDSSLMDRRSKSDKLSGGRSSADKSQSSEPPRHYEVGSLQCQAQNGFSLTPRRGDSVAIGDRNLRRCKILSALPHPNIVCRGT
jgi:hypothetical protein